MQSTLNSNVEVNKSSWVERLLYNGAEAALTVITNKGKSFDLLGVTEAEYQNLLAVSRAGDSVGTALQPLISARDNKGRLK